MSVLKWIAICIMAFVGWFTVTVLLGMVSHYVYNVFMFGWHLL